MSWSRQCSSGDLRVKEAEEMTEYVKHRGLKILSVYQRRHSPHEWA